MFRKEYKTFFKLGRIEFFRNVLDIVEPFRKLDGIGKS
ncbi:hypothetical protein LEP1GSC052_2572 [Leptospira kmetyi serovar Malaysia str. Bejo-Iso9]|nr:hypothetical protein LEP1GSC052_2572 [Leptospira kmetyi serovar Malaysia str. Bejo-Iso9]